MKKDGCYNKPAVMTVAVMAALTVFAAAAAQQVTDDFFAGSAILTDDIPPCATAFPTGAAPPAGFLAWTGGCVDGEHSPASGTWGATGVWVNPSGAVVAWADTNAYFGGTPAAAPTVTVGTAGTRVRNMTFATDGYTIARSGTGTLQLSGASAVTRIINVATDVVATIAAPLIQATGTASVTKTGAGTLVLSGANTYSGTTTVSAGTLQVVTGGTVAGAVTVSADGGDVLVDGGTLAGAITVNGGSLQIKSGTFSGTGAVQVATGRSIIFNNTAALTFPRAISGSGRLVKQGEGTLTLSGLTGATGTSNQYTTTVEEGRLVLDGTGGVTISGPVTVAGGELALNRQVRFTALSVGDGGTLENLFAGHQAATLTLNAGSTLKIVLDPLSTTPNFDVTGTVTLGGTLDYTDTIEEGVYLIIGASDVSGEFSSHPKVVGDYTHSIFKDDAGVTLKVEVKRDPHTVTFVDHDGTSIGAPQEVEHGGAAVAPATNPSRAGYRFTGWDVPFTNVRSNLVVTAEYIAVWTVTFVNGGTTVATYPNIDDGTPVSSLELPDNPCGGGYEFTGWNFGTTAVTANLTVTAGCVEIRDDEWTVTFVGYEDAPLKSVKVTKGEVLDASQIPDPKPPASHTFSRWDTDVTAPVTDNITVKGIYEIRTHTVRFLDADGTTVLLSRTVSHGALMSTVTPPSVTPPEGFIFVGWNPVIPSGDTPVTRDYTFTAVYEEFGMPINPLKVYRITPSSGILGQFEVAVRGFNALREYRDNGDQVNTIHVWYKPNNPAFTGGADTVPNGGRAVVPEARWPSAGVDTATFTFILQGAKWESVRDPYYYFNANVTWTPGGGVWTVLPPFHADSSFGYYLQERNWVMGRYGNTLTLEPTLGAVKPGQPAQLNIGNLSSLADFKDPVDYRPHIDSVGIWVRNAAAPQYPSTFASATNSGTLDTGFVFAGVVAAAGASGSFSFSYNKMPSLAVGVPSRDVFFLVAPRWRDATATPAVSRILADSGAGANICKVTIFDFPDLPLTVTINQPDLRAPLVNVTLVKNPGEEFDIDVDSIRIEFSLGGGVFPGTGFSSNTRGYSCAAFPAAGVVIPISNDNFVGALGQLHYKLSTKDATTGVWSDNVVGTLVTGRERPVLPATTSAELSNDMIRVVWGELKTGDGPGTNNLGSLDNSLVYIRYWEASGSQSAAVRDSVRAVSRNYTTRRLKENTEYRFEVVLADWVTRDQARASWNLFSDTVRVSATTGVASNEPNIVKMAFNPDSMWFKVVYTLIEDNMSGDELGVSFIVSHNGAVQAAKDRYKIIPAHGKANDIDSLYIYTDSLSERLKFNTVYDITLYSENSGIAYRDTEPVTVPAETVIDTSGSYTITFDANGGAISPPASVNAVTDTSGKLASLPTPDPRPDYTFNGWFTAASGGTRVTTATVFSGDTTIYAQWTPVGGSTVYTVTFDANSGTVSPVSAVTDTSGKLASLPTPDPRPDYTFNGWFTAASGGTRVTTATVFSGDTTIYAQWTQGDPVPGSVTHIYINLTLIVNVSGSIGSGVQWNFVSGPVNTIVLGGGVTSVGANAFSGISGCPVVISLNPNPPAVSANSFPCRGTLLVPLEHIAAYRKANVWKDFAHIDVLWVLPESVSSASWKGSGEAVVVAPAGGTASKLTAGPNPVSKSTGGIGFFYNGGSFESAALTIYDAAGNVVRKVNAGANAGIGHRQIAVWDLRGARGRLVSEGSYLVRGVVKSADGGREKVSLLVGVR